MEKVNGSTCWNNIDDILGDKSTRYFGEGYSHVTNRLIDIQMVANEKPSNPVTTATGVLSYPKNWSTKTDNTELTPHLSTVDALIFAIQINEVYLIKHFKLTDKQFHQLWLRKCSVVAGSEPLKSLNKIKIVSTCIEKKLSDDGHELVSSFDTQVGSLRVKSEFLHPNLPERIGEYKLSNIQDALSNTQQYYCSGYRNAIYDLNNVIINANNTKVDSDITITDQDALNERQLPYTSVIDSVILSGQIVQAFLYHIDHISRDQSNTLWMRQVDIESARPNEPLPNHFKSETSLKKTSLVRMKNATWRVAKMRARFQNIVIKYSVAHELPAKINEVEK